MKYEECLLAWCRDVVIILRLLIIFVSVYFQIFFGKGEKFEFEHSLKKFVPGKFELANFRVMNLF